MTTLIVLFNLHSGADIAAYEDWAKRSDLATVRNLNNCAGFDVYRTLNLLGREDPAPYQYVEVIQVSDLAAFRQEAQSDTMQAVAAEFRTFADNPIFMVSESIES